MGHSRNAALGVEPESNELTRDMAGIGMNFAVPPNGEAPIEPTLVFASALGMDEHDLRVLSVLTTWLGVHHGWVNADRLVRCVTEHSSPRLHAYWAAIASWLHKDRRFARLGKWQPPSPVDLLPVGTDFQIARHGEDERFVGSALRVPAGSLRDRPSDILDPRALARRHAGYRNRVHMGPTWRADVWTALERDPHVTIAEAARRAGCSFATAWQVARDFRILHAGA